MKSSEKGMKVSMAIAAAAKAVAAATAIAVAYGLITWTEIEARLCSEFGMKKRTNEQTNKRNVWMAVINFQFSFFPTINLSVVK